MSKSEIVWFVLLTGVFNLILLLYATYLISYRIKEIQKEITWLYQEVRNNKHKAKVFDEALKGLGVKIVWNIEDKEQNDDS